jgi:hypothetical protein
VAAGLAATRESTPAGVLLRLTRLSAEAQAPVTRELAERALDTGELPPETCQELEALRESAPEPGQGAEGQGWDTPGAVTSSGEGSGGGQAAGAASTATAGTAPVKHVLKVVEAVPVGWSDGKLTVEIGGDQRAVSARQLGAVAVAGITPVDGKAFVVVDLMLDPPWSDRAKLRVIRLRSNTFDPRTLVAIDDAQEAFRRFLADLIDESGAVGLPDPDGARGRPFRRYRGLIEFESEVLGVAR